LGSIVYIQTVQGRGQDRNLRHPCLYIWMRGQLPSTVTLNFLLEINELINLFKMDEKCNLESLYSKPGCHVVANAFSKCKRTAAVDILLLKFKVTWSVSRTH
jgi:hypothetical protein